MKFPLAMRAAPACPGASSTTTSRERWLRLSAALGAIVGVLVLAVAPAGAASAPTHPSRVTFGIEPASIGAIRPNFSFSATPGAVVNDNVAAVNYSSVPLPLQIYATDAVETSGGGFGLLPANQKPTQVGSWITLPAGTATVQVPAETPSGPGRVVIPFVVHVPVKATPGDHVGGIVASLQTTGTNTSGQRIVLDQRIGTRVFVRVAGTLSPQLAVTDLHSVYEGTLNPVGKGRVKISYLVSNTGNVDLGVDQSVALSGVIGDSHRADLPKIPLLLAGTSVSESVVVSGVWPQFLLHQTVTATPVALAGNSVSGLVPVTASSSVWAVPWTLLAIVVLVVLLVLLFLRLRRRRAARRGADEPVGRHAAQSKEPAGRHAARGRAKRPAEVNA